MSRAVARLVIGPEHDGMQMSLADFARAEAQPGYLYELEKGVVVVADLPDMWHALIVHRLRRAFYQYDVAHPGSVAFIGGGGESCLRMTDIESERHPDVSVYLTAPPADDPQPWDCWTPDIVIEVVSKSSKQRDYKIKPTEYLEAGVRLCCIVDRFTRRITVLTRKLNQWRRQELGSGDTLRTSLLPGFALKLADAFADIPTRELKAPRRSRRR